MRKRNSENECRQESETMTIKETAGKVLLYFYQLQRTTPLSMPSRQVGFIERKNGDGLGLTSDKKAFAKDLFDINPSSTDIYNAFTFLIHKGFIKSKERAAPGARIYVGVEVTVAGIDAIESIEGGHEGQQRFEQTFNIKVGGNATVESVIRDKLSALLNNN